MDRRHDSRDPGFRRLALARWNCARFAAANGLQILSTTIGELAPVILALTIGRSLVVVVPGIASAGDCGALAAYAFADRQEGPLRFSDLTRKRATVLLKATGVGSPCRHIIGPILHCDQMLIGAQLAWRRLPIMRLP